MALVNFTGFETGDNSSGIEMSTSGGSPTFVTSPVYSGTYAMQINPATTSTEYVGLESIGSNGADASPSQAHPYFSFRFRYATKPSSNDEEIFTLSSLTDTVVRFSIRINSSGQLVTYDSTPTLLATGSTALSANTWYRISGDVTNNGASSSYNLKIDGSAELSGSFTSAGAVNKVLLGKVVNRNGNTVEYYYDDLIIDDATEPSGYQIMLSKPIANGSTMQWTAGTNTSDYTQVDEIPPDSADYVKSTGTAGDVALFTIQSLSTLGISGATIAAIKAMIFVREDTSVTSSNLIRVKSSSTNSDSNSRNLTTTGDWTSRLLATDPATSAAWTESGFNAVEFGSKENNAVAMRMTWGAVQVLYTASATTTSTSSSTSTSSTSTSISTSSTSTSISTSSTSTSISTSTTTSHSTSTSISTSSTSTSISTSTTTSTSTSTTISTSSTSTSISTSTTTSQSTSTTVSTSSTSTSVSTSSTSTSISTSSTSTSISTSTTTSTSTTDSITTSTSSTSTSTTISTSTSTSTSTSSTSTSTSTTISTSTSTTVSETTSTSSSISTSSTSTSISTSTTTSASTSTSTSISTSSTSMSTSTSSTSSSTSVSTSTSTSTTVSTSTSSTSSSTSHSTSTSISTSSTSVSTSSTTTSTSTSTTMLDIRYRPSAHKPPYGFYPKIRQRRG